MLLISKSLSGNNWSMGQATTERCSRQYNLCNISNYHEAERRNSM